MKNELGDPFKPFDSRGYEPPDRPPEVLEIDSDALVLRGLGQHKELGRHSSNPGSVLAKRPDQEQPVRPEVS